MVEIDQCPMEAVEPRTIWIVHMGYEFDVNTFNMYAQHLLSKLVDEKEERFGTFKEKILSLHSQLTKLGMQTRVRK